ncbi:MAG TPA: hypothetical protein VIP70_12555 [Nitrososphaeraceae archaeon]
MPHFEFIYNLRTETFNTRIQRFADPSGYLLSVHRFTPQMIKFCLKLRREHNELIFADSGLFEKIRLTVDHFRSIADQLRAGVNSLEISLGHSARPNEITNNVRSEYQDFAKKISSHILDIEKQIDPKEILKQEQRIEPKRFICREDILLAILTGLSVEPEYVGMPRRFYSARNRRAATFYEDTKQKKFGSFKGIPYAVASAVDYNSAYDAGKEMAKAKVSHLAVGVGAYMIDDNSIDYFIMGRKLHNLNKRIPRRYLRTTLVVRGLMDGYNDIANKPPAGFHLLGLGAPIMILLVSLIASRTRQIGFDSTSPIKDAVVGTIYFNKPADKKVRARVLAKIFCEEPSNTWWCRCKYCKHYLPKYPFNTQKAASWYNASGRPEEITASDLSGDTELANALPLFGEPIGGGQIRKDINDWRIGHNHQVLESLFMELNKNSRPKKLLNLVRERVDKYCESTSPSYSEAAKIALSIATKKI